MKLFLFLHCLIAATHGLGNNTNEIMDHEDVYRTFIDGDLKDYEYNCMCGYRSE